ncbi:AAA family ATPase [Thermosulfidibacter takaii]|uniref:AAA family ATPase n=1 Tax=Thermosulfidibacter takaii TaxID=412593 RepID=UPI0008395AF3|nr:MoxR family ATPase [Thermosulfidibacter takaii]
MQIESIISAKEFTELQKATSKVKVVDEILDYIVKLGDQSRTSPTFRFGLSTRALIDLKKASQAWAFINARSYVIPDDVKEIFPYISHHRLITNTESDHKTKRTLIQELLDRVKVPV